MKTSIFVCLLVVVGCIVSSCNRTIVCMESNTIQYMRIADRDTAITYSLKIIGYERGSKFTKAIDSLEKIVEGSYSLVTDKNEDYRIIVLPANRVHTITDIHAGDEKRKGSPGRDSEQCLSSLTFTLDGKVLTQPFGLTSDPRYLKIEL